MIRPYRIMPRFDDGFSMDKQSGYPGMPNVSMPDPSMMGSMDPMTQRIYASAMQDRAIDDVIQSAQFEQAQQNVMGDNLANEVMARMMEDRAQQQAVRDIRRAASDRRRQGGGSGNVGGGRAQGGSTGAGSAGRSGFTGSTGAGTTGGTTKTGYSSTDVNKVLGEMRAAHKKYGVKGAQAVLDRSTGTNKELKRAASAMFNQEIRKNTTIKKHASNNKVYNGGTLKNVTVTGNASRSRDYKALMDQKRKAKNESFYPGNRYEQQKYDKMLSAYKKKYGSVASGKSTYNSVEHIKGGANPQKKANRAFWGRFGNVLGFN